MLTALMRARPIAISVMLAVTSAACDDSIVVVGVIETGPDPALIVVPDSAKRGEPARAFIRTYGSMCMSVEATEVSITEDGAEITPYDRRTPGKCVAALVQFSHEAEVSFETLGLKTIRVTGRRSADAGTYELVQKSFAMTVVE